jgi:hypothetical protein
MVIAKSSNGGDSFMLPQKVSNDNFVTGQCITTGAPMAFDSKGLLHIVWYTGKEGAPGIYYAVSSNQETFSKPLYI